MITVSHKGVRLIPSHACVHLADNIDRQRPLVMESFLEYAFRSTGTMPSPEHDATSISSNEDENSYTTHFVANGEHSNGSLTHVIPLMNTNPNLHTVIWHNLTVDFRISELSVHRFRRLSLWSCTISLRNLQDLLSAASHLWYFILEGWTSLVHDEDDINTEATLCSTMEHLHVNFSDTWYEDSDWLDADDAREAQYALTRFFDHAYVVEPVKLHEVVLKLSVRDVDVAIRLINHALVTMESLTLAYIDSTLSTTFINLDGGKNIREVHIKCVARRLHEIIYSLRTIDSLMLNEIQLHMKVFSKKDKLHALSEFDADVYQGRFPTLNVFGVHIDPWSMYDNDISGFKTHFREEVMRVAAYMREAEQLKFFWVPDESDPLSDVFLLSAKFDCAEGDASDDDYV
ncbi:uncharacterized protein ARMOST_20950 [Armillaria ostoyae]|uniref:F-box domain-containing protein n=1 Tax=Armillaria ostoyae TaxID=47428 RepID=A0A284S8U6_ARMOS|nr:uncharacterized protein ARMOST_20950 [Armillaria ostoyae]